MLHSWTECANTIPNKTNVINFFNFVLSLNCEDRRKTSYRICLNVWKNKSRRNFVTVHLQSLKNISNLKSSIVLADYIDKL